MPNEGQKLEDQIRALAKELASERNQALRHRLIRKIINRCVSTAALETDLETREQVRDSIAEILNQIGTDGRFLFSGKDRDFILKHFNTKITAVYQVSDALYGDLPDLQHVEIKDRDDDQHDWVPDFRKIFGGPSCLDK